MLRGATVDKSPPRTDRGGAASPQIVIPRACGGSSTPRPFGLITGVSGILDHSHARAMTTENAARQNASDTNSASSPRGAPSLARSLPRQRGAGNAGCALHPRSRVQSCAKSAHTSIQVQRKHSGIPRAMALQLMPRSPRRRIRLVTVIDELAVLPDPVGLTKTSADLTPATGVGTTRFCRTRSAFAKGFGGQARRNFQHGRNQHRSSCAPADRSRSPKGTRPAIACAPDAAASTASHPTFGDDGQRPSCGMRRRYL